MVTETVFQVARFVKASLCGSFGKLSFGMADVYFYDSAGLSARADARWYSEHLDGQAADLPINGLPGDDFWQFGVFGGYQFVRNQCEVSASR